MKKFWSGLCATAMASSFAIAGVIPANAAPPVYVPQSVQTTSDVQQVRHYGKRHGVKKRLRRNNRALRQSSQIIRRDNNNAAFYRNYHGSRYYRPGYRRHSNGFWFPAAAFIAGALITGAISNNRVYSGGNSHVSWCYDRWRSYRAYDNSYQPYNGPRRICYSPYN